MSMSVLWCVSDVAACSVGGSEALLEGRLDVLQQAPLSSVLPLPIGCLHLQAEAESHGKSHRETAAPRLGPFSVPGATHVISLTTHDYHMRQVPLTPFYR